MPLFLCWTIVQSGDLQQGGTFALRLCLLLAKGVWVTKVGTALKGRLG